jgi:DnaJ-class molecular chaperone
MDIQNRFITDTCSKCNGTGKVNSQFNDDNCWVCRGTGLVPNDEGVEILDLVARFVKNSYFMQHVKDTKKRKQSEAG